MGAPTSTLIEAARRLVDARAKAEEVGLIHRAKLAEFNERYAWLVEDRRAANDAVDAAEADVKALASAQYAATGNKKPLPGVEIKLYKVLSYNMNDALAWARETKLALTPERLDVVAFDKIAAATPLPFVTKSELPKVTLGKTIELPAVIEAMPAAEVGALDAFLGTDV